MLRCKLLQSLKIFLLQRRREERTIFIVLRIDVSFFCDLPFAAFCCDWVVDRRPSHRSTREIIAHSEYNARNASEAGSNHVAKMTRTKKNGWQSNGKDGEWGKSAEKSKGFGQIAFINFSTHIIIWHHFFCVLFSATQTKPLSGWRCIIKFYYIMTSFHTRHNCNFPSHSLRLSTAVCGGLRQSRHHRRDFRTSSICQQRQHQQLCHHHHHMSGTTHLVDSRQLTHSVSHTLLPSFKILVKHRTCALGTQLTLRWYARTALSTLMLLNIFKFSSFAAATNATETVPRHEVRCSKRDADDRLRDSFLFIYFHSKKPLHAPNRISIANKAAIRHYTETIQKTMS